MPVILLICIHIVGYFLFFTVFVYMTTNEYQLIQDLFKAFLWATEKTLVLPMLTRTANQGRTKKLSERGRAAREVNFRH